MLFNDHSLNPLSVFSNIKHHAKFCSPNIVILSFSRDNWLPYHNVYMLKKSLVFSHTCSLRSSEEKSHYARQQTNPGFSTNKQIPDSQQTNGPSFTPVFWDNVFYCLYCYTVRLFILIYNAQCVLNKCLISVAFLHLGLMVAYEYAEICSFRENKIYFLET